ncbi:MAG: alpha/beta hydrolase [Alphaproteobacteria bacterium]|nr:alpha/beta hydrolase [Alphaproteobacteria bacterium]
MKRLLWRHFYRRAGGWILTLVLVYGVFIGSLFVMQRSLMYFPDAVRFVPSEWALPEMKPLPVVTKDGLHLMSWYRPPQALDKLTVVFFQGNAGHLGYRNYKFRPWLDAGYGVLLVGYRGFCNPGSPSEQGLYMDARAAINAIRAKGVPENGMVFYGESMGTGVAVQMATEYPHAVGLILESPYTSIPDVGADRYPLVPVRWLLLDRFDSIAKIKKVHMPLLLLHGEMDQVIPIKFGKKLFAAANEPKQSYYVPDAGHNNVYNLKVQQIILNFLADLPTAQLLDEQK